MTVLPTAISPTAGDAAPAYAEPCTSHACLRPWPAARSQATDDGAAPPATTTDARLAPLTADHSADLQGLVRAAGMIRLRGR